MILAGRPAVTGQPGDPLLAVAGEAAMRLSGQGVACPPFADAEGYGVGRSLKTRDLLSVLGWRQGMYGRKVDENLLPILSGRLLYRSA